MVKKNDPDYVKQLLSLLRLSTLVQHRSFNDDVQMGRALWVSPQPPLSSLTNLPTLQATLGTRFVLLVLTSVHFHTHSHTHAHTRPSLCAPRLYCSEAWRRC